MKVAKCSRDEKKLEAFLNIHKKSLRVADMKIFLPFTINLDPYLKKIIKEEVRFSTLKGVFAKNKRGYRLTSNWIWWWLLLTLLLSVESIRRKGLKTTHTEECRTHRNSKSCIISIGNNSIKYKVNIYIFILPFRKLGTFSLVKFYFNLKKINYHQQLKKISHYQKISKTQIWETEMIFIFLE